MSQQNHIFYFNDNPSLDPEEVKAIGEVKTIGEDSTINSILDPEL